MRLTDLHVEGFRGLPASQQFDLDADAVVVVGVNGSGKTSFFDAVLWALTGHLTRVEDAGGDVRSGYSPSGETRVALGLREGESRIEIIRSQLPDEKAPRLTVDTGAGPRHGVAAEVALLEAIWPAGLDATESAGALGAALTRSVYLQQDLIRQFVEADGDRDRFDVLSELVGAGRVGELYAQFEQAKRAWTGATNVLRQELEPMIKRLESVQSQVDRVAAMEEPSPPASWDDWWQQLSALGVNVKPASIDAGDAASTLDTALRQLDATASRSQRRMALLNEMLSGPPLPSTSRSGAESLHAQLLAATQNLADAQERLNDARQRAAAQAKARQIEGDKNRQLADLARLALSHLGDTCPVCTQPYDREHTVAHLNQLISSVENADSSPEEDLSPLIVEASEAQVALVNVQALVDENRAASAIAEAARDDRRRRLTELGMDAEADGEALRDAVGKDQEVLAAVARLRSEGEKLALTLAHRGQYARRDELVSEASELRERASVLEGRIRERDLTGELAQQMLEAIRSAAENVVGMQLKHLEPLLARLYARIDPHPSLRDVSFRSWTERGRGRLRTHLADPVESFETELPATVLSSSQLNALAVATFLTLNLGVARTPLETAMLDDPLQSLDDVNLLGIVDLLRRVKQKRQLIVATHDVRFGDLLERKLRAVDGNRTVRIDLLGWSRHGPTVSQYEVPADEGRLQLAE